MSPFEVFFFRYTKPPQIEEVHVSCRRAKNQVTITKTRLRSRRRTAKAAAVAAYAGLPAEHPAKARLNDSRLINSFRLIYRHIPQEIKQLQSSRVTKKPSIPLRNSSSPHRQRTAPPRPLQRDVSDHSTPAGAGPAPPRHRVSCRSRPSLSRRLPPLHSGLRPGPAQPGLKRSRLRQRRPAARKEKGELPPAQGGGGRAAHAPLRECGEGGTG